MTEDSSKASVLSDLENWEDEEFVIKCYICEKKLTVTSRRLPFIEWSMNHEQGVGWIYQCKECLHSWRCWVGTMGYEQIK